jgi:hypothetical protein
MSEEKYGWVCPKCGVVLAPWMPSCDCVKKFSPSGPSTGGYDKVSPTFMWNYDPYDNNKSKITCR